MRTPPHHSNGRTTVWRGAASVIISVGLLAQALPVAASYPKATAFEPVSAAPPLSPAPDVAAQPAAQLVAQVVVTTTPDVGAPLPATAEPAAPTMPAAPTGAQPSAPPSSAKVQLRVSFNPSRLRNGEQTVAVVQARASGAAFTTTPVTIVAPLPDEMEFVPGLGNGAFDVASRSIVWRDVRLSDDGKMDLPFRVKIAATRAPVRLAVRPTVMDNAGRPWQTHQTVVHVVRDATPALVSGRDGGRLAMLGGRVNLDISPGETPSGTTFVVSGTEYALNPPSAIKPGVPLERLRGDDSALAAARVQDVNTADDEDIDIVRASLADPVLRLELFPNRVFTTPVWARIDLSGQVQDEMAAAGLTPAMVYRVETPYTYTYQVSPTLSIVVTGTRTTFEEEPFFYDAATGQAVGFLGHFSPHDIVLTDPTIPKPWKLAPPTANINLFRGSLTYDYPLAAPPMHDGLEPRLRLKYDSSAADGANRDPAGMGAGWTLDLSKVARKVRQHVYVDVSYYPIEQGPDNGNCQNPPNNGWCWYVVGTTETISGYTVDTEDKFTLFMDGRQSYLVSKTVTEYVTLNYEPLRILRCSNTLACGADALTATNQLGEYWQVWTPDGTRYVFGTDAASESVLNSGGSNVGQAWYLKSIHAPYRDDAKAGRASASYTYAEETDGSGNFETRLLRVDYGNSIKPDGSANATLPFSATMDYISRTVKVRQPVTFTTWANGAIQQRYVLGYDATTDQAGQRPLANITQVGIDGSTLPSVTFGITNSHGVSLVQSIVNGYGVTATVNYNFITGGHRVEWRQNADQATGWKDYTYYFYRDETVQDPATGQLYGVCYDRDYYQGQTRLDICRTPGYDWTTGGTYRLVGYPVVEEHSRNPLTPTQWLRARIHAFKFETWRLGQDFYQEARDADNKLLAEKWVTITQQLTTGLPAGVVAPGVSDILERLSMSGTAYLGPPKRTVIEYDPAAQGGTQLGQQTKATVYANGVVAGRTEVTYTMQASNWTLRQTMARAFDAGGARLSEQRFFHNPQGDVNFVQQVANPLGGGDVSRDSYGEYDLMGNLVRATAFDAYGAPGSVVTASRGGRVVTHGMDSAYGLFVVTATNPLNQSAVYDYYGVNGSGGAANQPFGALRTAFDPNSGVGGNGVITTQFSYDPFGRLRKVAKPGDTLAFPTDEYFYDDTLKPMRIQHFARNLPGAGQAAWGSDSGWWTGAGGPADNRALAAWERTFYDGLGRAIQSQTPDSNWNTGGTNRVRVTDTAYDALGRATQHSAPYTATDTGVYVSPSATAVRTRTQFDSLDRVIGVSGPDGETATTAYGVGSFSVGGQSVAGLMTTAIDPLYGRRDNLTDLLGRLVAVREYSATAPLTREEESNANVNASYACCLSADGKARLTKAAPMSTLRTDYFIWGWGSETDPDPKAIGPGQAAQFRLAISTTAGDPNDIVAIVDVRGTIAGHNSLSDIIATRNVYRGEFRGGLEQFTEFGLPFDNTPLGSARLEFRVWWAGNVQLAADRLTVYWSSAGNYETRYAYDGRDGLRFVTDTLGNSTVITYDGWGQKTQMSDPDMGGWSYQYDVFGNMVTQTDALNNVLSFSYDGLNRLTAKKNGATTLASYAYDSGAFGLGRRITASVPGLVTDTVGYDARGRVVTQTRAMDGLNYVTTLRYDSSDRVITTTLPTGEVMTQSFNTAGELAGTKGLSNYVSGASYNALGKLTRMDFGNSTKTFYNYFGVETLLGGGFANNYRYGRLRQICVAVLTSCGEMTTPASTLMTLRFDYDANDNVSVVADDARNEFWQMNYDPLNRLTQWMQVWSWTPYSATIRETYAFNGIGNITSKTAGSGGGTNTGAYTYGITRPHAVLTTTGNGWTFQYDANGNMTKRVEGGTTFTQAFNVENRLAAMTRTGNITLTQAYDADGVRVKKTDGYTTTIYIGNAIEVAISGTTRITTTYYFFGGQRVAMRQGVVVTWLHGDHLGSASLATDYLGAKVTGSDARYTPFGEYRSGLNGLGNASDNRFTGQKRLSGWNLDDFVARGYSAALGRFVSADTIVPRPGNPQALNRFSALGNNPLKFVDPTGHAICRTQQDCQDAASSPSGRTRYRQFTNLTRWLVKEMNAVAKYREVTAGRTANLVPLSIAPRIENPFSAAMLYDVVAGGRVFDFKDAIFATYKEDVSFDAMVLANRHQAAGNIFFGFLGTAMGFSPQALHAGAAAAEWKDAFLDKKNYFAGVTPDIRTAGDGIDDYHEIEFGISLYRATIGAGKEVTAQAFMALAANYADDMGREPLPSGAVVVESDARVGAFDGPTKPQIVPWLMPTVMAR